MPDTEEVIDRAAVKSEARLKVNLLCAREPPLGACIKHLIRTLVVVASAVFNK